MPERRLKVAFDLDETLGVPVTDGRSVIGWQMRPGCPELLAELGQQHDLVLWTVSNRSYVQKCLAFGLESYFRSWVTWDELPGRWKDVRTLGVDYLVDDSEYHRELAEPHGLAGRYIMVPAYGSVEDQRNPLEWVAPVKALLIPNLTSP
jgi:FMN phosphatase YigB (HAD superfamily)